MAYAGLDSPASLFSSVLYAQVLQGGLMEHILSILIQSDFVFVRSLLRLVSTSSSSGQLRPGVLPLLPMLSASELYFPHSNHRVERCIKSYRLNFLAHHDLILTTCCLTRVPDKLPRIASPRAFYADTGRYIKIISSALPQSFSSHVVQVRCWTRWPLLHL